MQPLHQLIDELEIFGLQNDESQAGTDSHGFPLLDFTICLQNDKGSQGAFFEDGFPAKHLGKGVHGYTALDFSSFLHRGFT